MSKKGPGLLSFVVGVAAGAAALFLSKPENRVKAKKVARTVATKAKRVSSEYKKNPEAFKKKVAAKAQVAAKRAVKVVKNSKVVVKTKPSNKAKSKKK